MLDKEHNPMTDSGVCNDSTPANANEPSPARAACGPPFADTRAGITASIYYRAGYDAAVQEVVAWLRSYPYNHISGTGNAIADAIEAGEYRA
jgi:hypothetical protein